MTFFGITLRKALQLARRPALIPTAIASTVVLASAVAVDHQNQVAFEQHRRADVAEEAGRLSARLEGVIAGNIQLLKGLVGVISTEPDMDQERFAAIAQTLFDGSSQLRSIAGAPDLVVSLLHPVKGNEPVLGLDYRTNEAQGAAVLRARDARQLLLAGPIDLVQGGRGLVGRLPVFTPSQSGEPRFWGVLSAAIDLDKLYRASGLLDEELWLDIALTGKDGLGAGGQRFFGSPIVEQRNPVTATVSFLGGSWQLSAVPKDGWDVRADNAWVVRLLALLAGALIIIPTFVTSRLMEERESNVEALRSREAELRRLSRRLRLALETSKVGVWEMDIVTKAISWDDRMNEIYGLPIDGGTRCDEHWHAALHPDDRERAKRDFSRAIELSDTYQSEYRVVTPDGTIRNIRAIGTVYRDPGAPPRLVGVNWDVSADVALNDELKRAKTIAEARNADLEAAKARIEHNALHDPLTGLPNRRYLDEILRQSGVDSAEDDGEIALLHIDLDRFKEINDTLGHAAGDAMLVHAAGLLRFNVRDDDFVARFGGDEFVVICRRDTAADRLTEMAGRIVSQLRQPVFYEGRPCRVGVSIGIAKERGPRVDGKRLMMNADTALYRAKSQGRNRYEVFTETMRSEVAGHQRLAKDIAAGLERGEFVAHYQPQFDARTMTCAGVEVLARWRHPQRGLLTPASFLDVAGSTEILSSIDRAMLRQALADLERWNAAGVCVPCVSVNVSTHRLHDETLIEELRSLRIAPGTISFQLVQSVDLDDGGKVFARNVRHIREMGIGIEINDFGIGEASIVGLLKLKPHRLKIDPQFVAPLLVSPQQRALIRSMVEIGKSLGVEIVAEGVETMEHARILKRLGCGILQGRAFAGSMPADDLRLFLLDERWRGVLADGEPQPVSSSSRTAASSSSSAALSA